MERFEISELIGKSVIYSGICGDKIRITISEIYISKSKIVQIISTKNVLYNLDEVYFES